VGSHTAVVSWSRNDARFVDGRYSRAHVWRFDGGIEVPASSSPRVVPVPMSAESAVDPEEAFVAALASCHMLWFLSLAAEAGLVVDRYDDDAEGVLALGADGRRSVTEVVLRPRVAFAGQPPSAETHRELHERAHRECFLANSVKTTVRVAPQTVVASGPRRPRGPGGGAVSRRPRRRDG
jgi:organic hydroperoxide reductase OsmC/OhrA